ncbi:MAG: cyclic pyranopterin monophosphate synthase MoaC [bacterium]
MSDLSHLDPSGRVRMVDVSAKEPTGRTAVAEGYLRAAPDTIRRIVDGTLPKGDFRPAVQLAAIAAAKRASDLIPLCHPLPLDHVAVEVEPEPEAGRVRVVATATARARTGVEMEALCAVSVGLLTAYDLLKAVDRNLRLDGIRLLEKRGGRSGSWKAADA